jgi:hypothetical protein
VLDGGLAGDSSVRRSEAVSISEMARVLGVSRNTLNSALPSAGTCASRPTRSLRPSSERAHDHRSVRSCPGDLQRPGRLRSRSIFSAGTDQEFPVAPESRHPKISGPIPSPGKTAR